MLLGRVSPNLSRSRLLSQDRWKSVQCVIAASKSKSANITDNVWCPRGGCFDSWRASEGMKMRETDAPIFRRREEWQ